MERLGWICLAGAAGTGVRYGLALWAGQRFGPAFPYATLIANIAGCFLIGLVAQLALVAANFSPTLRLALTVGFMGGLTTYSSFAHETTRLVHDGNRGVAFAYFVATTIVCFAAVETGNVVARLLTRSA